MASRGLGLGVLVLLLAIGCTHTVAPHRKYSGQSPGLEFRGSKVTVPSVFKDNANQVASKVTKALNTAALKFPRRNVLNSFKKYTGGFEITQKDYWISVAFVGIWGYGLSFLCMVFAILICACKCCCYLCGYTLPDKEAQPRSAVRNTARLATLSFLVLFIVSGCSVLFWGTWKTGVQLKRTSNVLINATDFIFDTSGDIVHSLNTVATIITDPPTLAAIQTAVATVGDKTDGLSSKVDKIKSKIPLYIQLVVIFLALVGTFVLVFSIIGLVGTCISSSKLGTTAFLGMGFMIVFVWLLAGIDFTLSNVMNDACQGMDDYLTSPGTSTIANFLPCGVQADADSVAADVKAALKNVIAQINAALTSASGALPLICDPFGGGPTYSAVACGGATKLMANFESDYAVYHCGNDDVIACNAASTPLTASLFAGLAQANAAGALVENTIPNLGPAITCGFINDAFTILTTARCVRLIDGLNIVWFGFAIVGACMMPLQIIWILI